MQSQKGSDGKEKNYYVMNQDHKLLDRVWSFKWVHTNVSLA